MGQEIPFGKQAGDGLAQMGAGIWRFGRGVLGRAAGMSPRASGKTPARRKAGRLEGVSLTRDAKGVPGTPWCADMDVGRETRPVMAAPAPAADALAGESLR